MMVDDRTGFSLIEVLITLVIIGLLTIMAVPLYSQYWAQEQRIEAETALVQLASALEEYFIANNTYEGAGLQSLGFAEHVANNKYRLAITAATVSGYQLTAAPLQPDELCGTLTLNETGEKGTTGTGKIIDCW